MGEGPREIHLNISGEFSSYRGPTTALSTLNVLIDLLLTTLGGRYLLILINEETGAQRG